MVYELSGPVSSYRKEDFCVKDRKILKLNRNLNLKKKTTEVFSWVNKGKNTFKNLVRFDC